MKKTKTQSQWSLVLPTFVIHGMKPSEEASSAMPRKIDTSGDSVITPGLGLKYEGNDGSLFVMGVVKDCYDNYAGALQYGFYSRLSKETHWGLTAGLYIRETPFTCNQFGCENIDDLSQNFGYEMNGHPIDIIPMPFFHFSTQFYKDADTQIHFKMMSNLLLNEFAFAFPF